MKLPRPSRPSPSPSADGAPPTRSPGAQRRQELRQARRTERLRQGWRLVVFSAMAVGLGYGLLRQGWVLRQASQVEVRGSRLVSRDQVIQAAGLQFPQPLLALEPKRISADLSGALPVEKVRVSRLMLPPRLRVELVDREAVARAERRSAEGIEQGYVDRLGNWISSRQRQGLAVTTDLPLKVIGWNERHRPVLAQVLARRQWLGSGLQEIRFEPDGSLWITTAALGRLRFGSKDGHFDRRLEVAAHLSESLPASIRRQRPQLIDLTDPEQPEVSLPGPVRGGELTAPVAAAGPPPRGGQ